MKVVILYGEVAQGAGADEQDALVQAEAISHALRKLGHQVETLSISLDTDKFLKTIPNIAPDKVFNIVESLEGQGRLIHTAPALLDSLRIPYTGCPTEAIYTTSNKLLAKERLHRADIPTPTWFSLDDLQQRTTILEGRYIIKSVWEHASIGISESSILRTSDARQVAAVLKEKLPTLGGEGFVEAFIEGREFNLALLGGNNGVEILPPAEISFDTYPEGKLKIVDYLAKWDDRSFEFHNTPRRFTFPPQDADLLQRLKTIANTCWNVFKLRGYARVDFRVDQQGNPWVLEINTNPCLSQDAGFFAAAQQAGLEFTQVVDRILQDSCSF